MTLDEAIKHAEEVMAENLEKTKGRNASDPIAINCFERADEHRQLAEWLKELKQRTGRWRKVSMDKYIQHATYYYECSECGDQHIGQVNYCSNCGARMEVEE